MNTQNLCCTQKQAQEFSRLGVAHGAAFFFVAQDDGGWKFSDRKEVVEFLYDAVVDRKKKEAGIKKGQWYQFDQDEFSAFADKMLIDAIGRPENVAFFPAYNAAELGAMLLGQTKSCSFHNLSGMWTHDNSNWNQDSVQNLFLTQAQVYADRLLFLINTQPVKWNVAFVNARLKKFYELKPAE